MPSRPVQDLPRWASSPFALAVSSVARRPPRFSWPPPCGLPLRPSGPQRPDLPGQWQKSHEELVPCSLDATCTHPPCPRPTCGSLNPSPGPRFHPSINQGVSGRRRSQMPGARTSGTPAGRTAQPLRAGRGLAPGLVWAAGCPRAPLRLGAASLPVSSLLPRPS